jgi:hypothetical protein
VMLHLEIMKARPDVQSVVHCHPRRSPSPVSRSRRPFCPRLKFFSARCPSRPTKRLATKNLLRRSCRLFISRT